MVRNSDAVGVTATRNGITADQSVRANSLLGFWRENHLQFRHGDCIGGDADLARIARRHGYYVVGHPPVVQQWRAFVENDHTLEPLPFLDRNRRIVNASAILLACPDGPDYPRSGTWMTVRYARSLRVPTVVIMPSGECLFDMAYRRTVATP